MMIKNKLRKGFLRLLSSSPLLKKCIKSSYLRLVLLLNKKKYKSIFLNEPTSFDGFFGYYDKSPENPGGNYVLYHVPRINSRVPPDSTSGISIAVDDLVAGTNLFTLNSLAYNWQQGTRLQWLSDNEFIFNDFDPERGCYISRIYSVIDRCEVKRFNRPIQDCFKSNYLLSIDFSRLMALRPDYGYRNLPPLDDLALKQISDDGIWKIDFSSGYEELLVSFADIVSLGYISHFDVAIHKINHIMICPSGKKFMFLHRYYTDGNRYHRLIVADSETGKLRLLPSFGMISHCFWINDLAIVGYMRGPDAQDGYWIIDLANESFSKFECEALEKLGDGHPNVYGEWMVTDSYPDRSSMQHLVLVNLKSGEYVRLCEVFHGLSYMDESRCDLHPRFNSNGTRVYFDSVCSGERKMYSIDVSQYVE